MGCGLYGYSGFYGNIWVSILTVALRFILFLLVVKLVIKMVKGYKNHNDNRDTLNVLDQMLVKGEITEDEYKLKKRIILEK